MKRRRRGGGRRQKQRQQSATRTLPLLSCWLAAGCCLVLPKLNVFNPSNRSHRPMTAHSTAAVYHQKKRCGSLSAKWAPWTFPAGTIR
jgi:hypothetical protein